MYYVCNVTNNERLSPASRDMLISLKAIFSRTNMSSCKCQKYMMISSSSSMVPCSRNYRSGNVRCEGRGRDSARGEGRGDGTVLGWGWGRRNSARVRVGCQNLQGVGDGKVGEVRVGVPKPVRDSRWHNVEGEGGCPNLRRLRDGAVREVRLRLSKYRHQTNVGLGGGVSGYDFILCFYVCITKYSMLTYVANVADFDSNAMCEMISNLCSVVIFNHITVISPRELLPLCVSSIERIQWGILSNAIK